MTEVKDIARPLRPPQCFHNPVITESMPNGSGGFTLIETLIASAILAIGILGVVSMVASGVALDKRAHHLTQASLIFEDIVELMLFRQYEPQLYRNMTAPGGIVMREGARYAVNCTLAADTPFAPCTEMTCRISWTTLGRSAQTRHAYTFAPK